MCLAVAAEVLLVMGVAIGLYQSLSGRGRDIDRGAFV